jgi:niacin transporter
MEHKSVYQLVLAGVLCAIGLAVPMVMPKVILGPMSFTLGSHVAIFLAMFISPKVTTAVVLGTTVGFFLTTPLIIAMRAGSHIIFALLGAFILRRHPEIMRWARFWSYPPSSSRAICSPLNSSPQAT